MKTKNLKNILLSITVTIIFSSCTKDLAIEPIPVISISDIRDIDVTTAAYTGTISSDGGTLITERGICWKGGFVPTISDNKTVVGEGAGTFTGKLSGLKPNTRYYLRAFAASMLMRLCLDRNAVYSKWMQQIKPK